MHIRCTYQNVNAYLAMTEMCIDIIDGDVQKLPFFIRLSTYIIRSVSFVPSIYFIYFYHLTLHWKYETKTKHVSLQQPQHQHQHQIMNCLVILI